MYAIVRILDSHWYSCLACVWITAVRHAVCPRLCAAILGKLEIETGPSMLWQRRDQGRMRSAARSSRGLGILKGAWEKSLASWFHFYLYGFHFYLCGIAEVYHLSDTGHPKVHLNRKRRQNRNSALLVAPLISSLRVKRLTCLIIGKTPQNCR